ncbi:hypothetical protein [Flavobacterium sp. I3-2]|uniref:hypothetical protein n=1 Tax=Flavobacterium sp. I3-2 TaxID=2748319 RepID=UPI0015AA492F|nr:hypothetical protein [Flavobacterium sp. I3-2]
MKKILLSALMLSTLAVVSCNDSDDNSVGQDTGVYLPTKIESTENKQTFVYDSENRLIESKEINDDGSYTNHVTFGYLSGKLVSAKEITTEVGDTQTYVSTGDYTFTYQNNEVTITEVNTSNWGSSTETTVVTIDSNGRLISGENLSTVYDANGNLTKLVDAEGTETFEYDNKNGIFKNVKTPQWAFYVILDDWYYLNVNNITKMTWDNTSDNEVDFSNLNYEYNAANYPVKINVAGSDNFTNSVAVEYIKK